MSTQRAYTDEELLAGPNLSPRMRLTLRRLQAERDAALERLKGNDTQRAVCCQLNGAQATASAQRVAELEAELRTRRRWVDEAAENNVRLAAERDAERRKRLDAEQRVKELEAKLAAPICGACADERYGDEEATHCADCGKEFPT